MGSVHELIQTFMRKWQLEEHVAVDHDSGGKESLACLDCGKEWVYHQSN